MADPLSLVSSLAGLIAVGSKLAVDLYQFIETIRSAPGDIRNLAKELTDLCSILKRLQTTFSNTNNGSLRHKELSQDFLNVLDSCMEKFVQLQVLIKNHEVKDGDGMLARKWKQWSWTLQEKEVMALRAQLEAHKATLNITLLLSTHSETRSVKETTDRIESTVREIMERLMESGDGETIAGRYEATSSFVLKRYLSSASSTFSSRAASPVLVNRPSLSVVEERSEEDISSSKRPGRRDSKARVRTDLGGLGEKECDDLKVGVVSESGQKAAYIWNRQQTSPNGHVPYKEKEYEAGTIGNTKFKDSKSGNTRYDRRKGPSDISIPQVHINWLDPKSPISQSPTTYDSSSEFGHSQKSAPPSPSSYHGESSFRRDSSGPVYSSDEQPKLLDWLVPQDKRAKLPGFVDTVLLAKANAARDNRCGPSSPRGHLDIPNSPAELSFTITSEVVTNESFTRPRSISRPNSMTQLSVVQPPVKIQDSRLYFGQPLKMLMKRDERPVPGPVYNCLCTVFHFGFKTEGVYRFNGSKQNVETVRQNFDSGKSFDFEDASSFNYDIHCISDVLKQFFRELPEPLVTKALYDEFINAARIVDDLARRKALHEIINRLPDSNYATLRAVALHLFHVQEHSDVNRMSARELAVEFVEPLMGNINTSGGPYYVLPWKVRAIESIILNAFVIFDVDGIELKTRSFLYGLTGR